MKLSKNFLINISHLVALIFLVFLSVFFVDVYLDAIVITKQGWIRGFKASDGDYTQFLGIPYATVSKDSLFGDSIPYPKFDGIFQANNDKIICPQIDLFSLEYTGTIDCLHLNIYVPNSKEPKPVMIFIHGGRFVLGHTGTFKDIHLHGPRYFMKQEIVLVTVSYRLGPYGFICTDSIEAPGNQGLKDVTKAISWVEENIQAFGGDTSKITIFGHSAGSMITDLLLYTKAGKNIDQAILQSGSIYTFDLLRAVNNSIPFLISKQLGFETSDLHEALQFLGKQEPKDVVEAAKAKSIEFRPCLEKEIKNYEGLLYIDPYTTDVNMENKKIITGFTTEENNIKVFRKPEQFFKDNDVIGDLLNYEFNFSSDVGKEAVSSVQRFYTGDGDGEIKWKIANFTSDVTFNYPIHRNMNKFLRNGAKEVYFYIFAYNSSSNLYKSMLNISQGRSIHGDELSYLFETNAVPPLIDNDFVISERLTYMWSNFAKYGNPTPKITDLTPVKWLPISKEKKNYLLIDLHEEMGEDLFGERIDFWHKFYETYKSFIRKEKAMVNIVF